MRLENDGAVVLHFLDIAVKIVLMPHVNTATEAGELADQLLVGHCEPVGFLYFWQRTLHVWRHVRQWGQHDLASIGVIGWRAWPFDQHWQRHDSREGGPDDDDTYP